MAKPQGVIPSPEAWAEIVDTVRHTRVHRPVRKARRMPRRRNGGSGGVELRDAELTANLSPASNSKTGAATASAKFLDPDPDNPGDLMDGDTFTVTNRSLDSSGLNGDYIVVAPIGNEWRPVWIDC